MITIKEHIKRNCCNVCFVSYIVFLTNVVEDINEFHNTVKIIESIILFFIHTGALGGL